MHPLITRNREAVQQARQQLHAACLEPGTPPDSVRLRVRALTAAQGRLDSVVTETLLQELTQLNSEQRRKYLATMPWDQPPGKERPGEPRGRGHRRDG
jgi:hypothetical protein